MLRRIAAAASMLVFLDPRPACATADAEAWEDPRRVRFEYSVDFSELDVPDAAKTRVWVPYPWSGESQKTGQIHIDAPWEYRITSDRSGNRMIYMEGRGQPPAPLTVRFDVERLPYRGVPRSGLTRGGIDDPQRYLDAPRLIPLQGTITELAGDVGEGLDSNSEKVWAFYDYVYRTMSYDKSGTGWGRGDAIWACDNKRGNCTDFHSLFIGMALSEEIPARFVIGFPLPSEPEAGSIGGYHCWAEFFDDQRGWTPIDASEARKRGQKTAYFGALPNDRVQFTLGRDLTLEPPQDSGPLNYFIYPHVEIDGVHRPMKAKFSYEPLAESVVIGDDSKTEATGN